MRFRLLFIGALVFTLFYQAQAILPDALKFPNANYIKVQQKLYEQPVKRVCLRLEKDSAYPSAVIFGTKIVFLGKDGFEVGRDSFPESKELKITESVHGEYIYLFGLYGSGTHGGFHRLYSFDGKVIISREDSTTARASNLGVPLENQKAFLRGGSGQVSLTTFDGTELSSKRYLNLDNYEDGDIYVATSPDETGDYAIVNKYKIPEDNERPILYGYDSKLNELFRDTLDCPLGFSPQCSENGKYLSIKEECENTSNPFLILDPLGRNLISLDNPKTVEFASGSDYFVYVPRDLGPEIFSSTNRQASYKPDLPVPEYPWSDAAISSDGSLVTLYNGDEIVLVNTAMRSWNRIDFPYAFEDCRLYNNGKTIILRGEFGFVIYKSGP
jgi:hypothetical protein